MCIRDRKTSVNLPIIKRRERSHSLKREKPFIFSKGFQKEQQQMSVYDEVEIEDLDFNAENQTFYYPCPCGDKFQITLDEIKNGEDIAKCPSCSLTIKIIYDEDSHQKFEEEAATFRKPQAVCQRTGGICLESIRVEGRMNYCSFLQRRLTY
eukprot:TRINITY_DN1638_c0_g1_i2.p1 TRINITY_DN1638_c0_g1~~TRINITY_DN1638_c0_g1_i2.p1  ORF type:complete len:172 (+),score=40.86 TRINITY_DN1638_c0_g1_i2:61-516(+)